MERRRIRYLEVRDIYDINARVTSNSRSLRVSLDNVKNHGCIPSALLAIQDPQKSRNYRRITDKAAFLAHRIMVGHAFHDGNTRTALYACQVFLRINGCHFDFETTPEEASNIMAFTKKVIRNEIGFEDFAAWVRMKTKCRPRRMRLDLVMERLSTEEFMELLKQAPDSDLYH